MDKLKVEYLLITNISGAFCSNIETLTNLLKTNADIKIKNKKIHYIDLEVDYDIQTSEIMGKNQRYFHINFICNDINKINEFEQILKAIRTTINKVDGQINVLWNDISFYYSTLSYPLIHEVENLMRKLIMKFMLTNIGMDWDKETLPNEIKGIINSNKNKRSNVYTNFLFDIDFIDLAEFLFKPYQTENVEKLYNSIRNFKSIEDVDIRQLKAYVPKSNWTRYFSKIVECEDGYLKKKWGKLYELRCLIAHNSILQKEGYNEINEICKELKPIIQKAISSLEHIYIPEQDKEMLAENMAASINDKYREFLTSFQSVEVGLQQLYSLFYKGVFSYCPEVTIRQIIEYLSKHQIIDENLLDNLEFVIIIRNTIVHFPNSLTDEEPVIHGIEILKKCNKQITELVASF